MSGFDSAFADEILLHSCESGSVEEISEKLAEDSRVLNLHFHFPGKLFEERPLLFRQFFGNIDRNMYVQVSCSPRPAKSGHSLPADGKNLAGLCSCGDRELFRLTVKDRY